VNPGSGRPGGELDLQFAPAAEAPRDAERAGQPLVAEFNVRSAALLSSQ